ncbi:uncharacterized protein LOC114258446 [Camellia sinensis]|uniref:uncharacterized protein LOC114258446 n=1 Tax=Camellia sinensis TaxID=4442 RepID=UPI001035FA00|nr:uncharacterized protein LOC114258446 [Camellia sinensis]
MYWLNRTKRASVAARFTAAIALVEVRAKKRFNQAWFSEFPNWLEYSIAKDAAFCLCCYLFKPDIGDQAGGDSFVGEGFSNWKKKEKIHTHVGGPNSVHSQALSKCQDLLKQGLAFRWHDESENSSNQGNFLELLKFLADHNEDVKVVALSNAPQNLKLTSPDIQKDIANVAAFETINVIIRDLSDALFSILIDEAHDISIKKKMTVVIRYVDKMGQVIERFLGIEHVANTNTLSLKQAVENLFSRLRMSTSRLRGQGYDGASNMQDLALLTVAKNHNQIILLFTLVSNVVNVVGPSRKRRDIVREKQVAKVTEALNTRELSSRQGINQETNLKHASDIRWGSHYVELMVLNDQLVIDILCGSEFSILNGISDLAKKMAESGRDKVYPLVYLLLTLALILLVATATVERVFSAMNIVKNRLRNRIVSFSTGFFGYSVRPSVSEAAMKERDCLCLSSPCASLLLSSLSDSDSSS